MCVAILLSLTRYKSQKKHAFRFILLLSRPNYLFFFSHSFFLFLVLSEFYVHSILDLIQSPMHTRNCTLLLLILLYMCAYCFLPLSHTHISHWQSGRLQLFSIIIFIFWILVSMFQLYIVLLLCYQWFDVVVFFFLLLTWQLLFFSTCFF